MTNTVRRTDESLPLQMASAATVFPVSRREMLAARRAAEHAEEQDAALEERAVALVKSWTMVSCAATPEPPHASSIPMKNVRLLPYEPAEIARFSSTRYNFRSSKRSFLHDLP